MASPTADEVADMRRRRAEGASIARIMAATGWGRTAVRNALAPAPDAPVDISDRPARSVGAKNRRNAKTKAKPAKTTKSAGQAIKSRAKLRTAAAGSEAGARADPKVNLKRGALVARLWRTADAQVREVERRLAQGETEPGDREKDARTLAVVVKTLRDLLALEADEHTVEATAAKEKGGDVRDLDDFRRELAERIDRLRRARDADVAVGGL
ncbi:hypothetical protein CHELA1G11_13169 [Hyphomicrobiales bacterium]|nr:hypothetical protein CHELA1G2_11141 [Hyphomicrobiales bacterium]CAH1669788.1 hypothetical protein CHELA1G11_13169 [Hyphomicrobiales bacterium]